MAMTEVTNRATSWTEISRAGNTSGWGVPWGLAWGVLNITWSRFSEVSNKVATWTEL